MPGVEPVEKLTQTTSVALGGERLVGIGPARRLHGGGLTAPDELRAAAPEVAPAAQGELARRAVGVGVPALHRVDAPAIAHASTGDCHRLRERRALLRGIYALGDRQIEAQLAQAQAEGF